MNNETTEYFLMHKDIPVCMIAISDDGIISKIRRISGTEAHFPLGGQMNDLKFRDWWRDRAIPKTRQGAKTALQRLGYSSTGSALVNNLALSLSDTYWIRPRLENIRWKDVNLFTNDFVDTFGELTLNPNHEIDIRTRTRFNCATSQGELQKKWCIDKDGRRYMVKGNYGQSYQQSINEIFASSLHKKQGFGLYTSYSPVRLQVEDGTDGLGCLCYDYCSDQVESISAWELLQTVKTKQNESLFYPLKAVCLELGMSEEYFTSFMDYEILSDFLITNTDRHMNNIAVLRNPDTLELLGFAPIFDSGNSMFYNIPYERLKTIHLDDIRTHSFIEKEQRLLRYVQNRNALDLNKTEMDFSIYELDLKEQHIRIPVIKELFERKMKLLESFQSGQDIWKGRKRITSHV